MSKTGAEDSLANNIYSDKFYEKIDREGRSSAKVVVPMVMEMFSPKSVVDIGCGQGVWLSIFEDAGVEHIAGFDGDWIDPCKLAIRPDQFRTINLNTEFSQGNRFDLAICLEVAEHLQKKHAKTFVRNLVSIAPVILFSAAIPGQIGTNHINEQWPEYWEALFYERGYVRLDPFRFRIWRDSKVAWYYQQNMFVYVEKERVANTLSLQNERRCIEECPLTLVHPKVFAPLKRLKPNLKLLPSLFIDVVVRRIRKILGTSEILK